MKKALLLFLSLFFATYILHAQCTTCKQGQHDPKDPTAYLNAPVHGGRVGNGNNALNQSYILQNVCGLNYALASVVIETRSAGFGFNDSGSGFPASLNIVASCGVGSPLKAYVYWEASYTEASAPATTVTITNPLLVSNTFPGVLIGTGPNKCWAANGTASYRADVTPIISGNGTYKINSLNGFANAAWEVDGATLIIIYTTSANYSGSIALYDGCDVAIGGTLNYTLTGFTACAAATTASTFNIFGDMQDNVNAGINDETFNGSTGVFWNDFWNTEVINTTLTSGQSSSVYNSYTNNGGDCYAWVLAGLYWQNTTCIACVASSLHVTTTQVNPTCGNNNGSITVGVTGGILPYTYVWHPAVSSSSNATGLSVGVYVVTVTDSTGCNSGTDTVKLVNPTAPTLTITSTPEKCYGQSAGSATVTARGGSAPYTYKWTPGGGTTASITGLSAGTYTVLVTDALGCQSVDFVTVAQPGKLSVGVDSLINVKCNGGNNGAIYVTGNGGTPAYNYLWSNGNTSTSVTNVGPSTYTITVTDANGCTADTVLSVTQPPPMVINATSFDASCGVSNGFSYVSSVVGGTGPYSYLWTNGNPSSFNFGLSAGVYCVTVTDANGCSDSACVTVNNLVSFTLNINSVVNVACFGGKTGSATVNVTGHTPPYTYSWSTAPPQTNATATGLSAGTYTVTVQDNSGCSTSDVVTITQPPQLVVTCGPPVNVPCNGGNVGSDIATATGGTGAYTYSWNTLPVQTNAAATGLSAGTYIITVTDANGCTATASTTVTKNPSTVICSHYNQMICIGQTVILSATASGGTPAYTYTWNNATTAATYTVSPVVTTVYTVTATDAGGCTSNPVTDTVKVRPPLILTVTPQSISACSGSNVTLTAVANGGDSIYTYTWMPGNLNGSPLIVSPSSNTVYTVTVTDACGTPSATATASVFINPIPSVGFVEDSVKGCSPLCVSFKDTSTIASGKNVKWAWNFGDGGKDTVQNPTHCYVTHGSFSVSLVVTSDSGCSSSLTIARLVTVYAHPVASFGVSPQPTTIMAPTIYFTDFSSDLYGIKTWSWSFNDVGDSGISSLQNPIHAYKDTGTFCPELRVTNIYGCTDSTTQCLIISPQFTLYIPDAFSPNSDGRNDIFLPKGEALQTYEMYIFDRWGMKLFHSTSLYNGWDGTFGGKVCQEDTYVYLINIIDNFQKGHSYIGKVTLLQ